MLQEEGRNCPKREVIFFFSKKSRSSWRHPLFAATNATRFLPFFRAAKHKTATVVESSTRRLIDPTGDRELSSKTGRAHVLSGDERTGKPVFFFFARKDHEVDVEERKREREKKKERRNEKVLRRPIFWDKSGESYDRCLWPFSLCPPSNLSIGHCINEPCYRDIDNTPLFLFFFFAIFTLYFFFIDRSSVEEEKEGYDTQG